MTKVQKETLLNVVENTLRKNDVSVSKRARPNPLFTELDGLVLWLITYYPSTSSENGLSLNYTEAVEQIKHDWENMTWWELEFDSMGIYSENQQLTMVEFRGFASRVKYDFKKLLVSFKNKNYIPVKTIIDYIKSGDVNGKNNK